MMMEVNELIVYTHKDFSLRKRLLNISHVVSSYVDEFTKKHLLASDFAKSLPLSINENVDVFKVELVTGMHFFCIGSFEVFKEKVKDSSKKRILRG